MEGNFDLLSCHYFYLSLTRAVCMREREREREREHVKVRGVCLVIWHLDDFPYR